VVMHMALNEIYISTENVCIQFKVTLTKGNITFTRLYT
jgi:hypothetical protein